LYKLYRISYCHDELLNKQNTVKLFVRHHLKWSDRNLGWTSKPFSIPGGRRREGETEGEREDGETERERERRKEGETEKWKEGDKVRE
jgi:hypothetical protein